MQQYFPQVIPPEEGCHAQDVLGVSGPKSGNQAAPDWAMACLESLDFKSLTLFFCGFFIAGSPYQPDLSIGSLND